jgi:hypothetical protein
MKDLIPADLMVLLKSWVNCEMPSVADLDKIIAAASALKEYAEKNPRRF